jgi:hypothetical protein
MPAAANARPLLFRACNAIAALAYERTANELNRSCASTCNDEPRVFYPRINLRICSTDICWPTGCPCSADVDSQTWQVGNPASADLDRIVSRTGGRTSLKAAPKDVCGGRRATVILVDVGGASPAVCFALQGIRARGGWGEPKASPQAQLGARCARPQPPSFDFLGVRTGRTSLCRRTRARCC